MIGPERCMKLRRYTKDEVRLLYHKGYWDGPLSGACIVEGERLWFGFASETKRDRVRTYRLYRLTPEQWETEDYWHGLFRQHVGTHTEYDDGQRHHEGRVVHSSQHSKFYEPYQTAGMPSPDVRGLTPIGMFTRP